MMPFHTPIQFHTPTYTKTREEIRREAVDRAAAGLADVVEVLRRGAGVDDGALPAETRQALVLVSHQLYTHAVTRVEVECEDRPLGGGLPPILGGPPVGGGPGGAGMES